MASHIFWSSSYIANDLCNHLPCFGYPDDCLYQLLTLSIQLKLYTPWLTGLLKTSPTCGLWVPSCSAFTSVLGWPWFRPYAPSNTLKSFSVSWQPLFLNQPFIKGNASLGSSSFFHGRSCSSLSWPSQTCSTIVLGPSMCKSFLYLRRFPFLDGVLPWKTDPILGQNYFICDASYWLGLFTFDSLDTRILQSIPNDLYEAKLYWWGECWQKFRNITFQWFWLLLSINAH